VTDQFPCLGLSLLGQCLYNPAQPNPVYFSVGNAIAALALTLAVQQFLTPIYRFRLRAYGLKIGHLIFPVFVGFLCAVIAALLPSLPLRHQSLLEYPVVWELIGAFSIAFSYGVATLIISCPARIYSFNFISFISAAATLLTEADDTDRTRLAEDLLVHPHNMTRLIKCAHRLVEAHDHAAIIAFDRLRDTGAALVIHGRPPISAFYQFAHRKELREASHAATFLRVLCDPHFCSVLVRRCPWLTASFIQNLSKKLLHTDELEPFIQEISRQAIVDDGSIISKESGYEGFGVIPILSESLFGNWFILRHYQPMQKMDYPAGREVDEGYIARLNLASKTIVQTAIREQDWYPQRYMAGVHAAYKSVLRHLRYKRYEDVSVGLSGSLHLGIAELYKEVREAFDKMPTEKVIPLYATREQSGHWVNLVAEVAAIVYESLESMANSFKGYDDPNWHHAISVFQDVFPIRGDVPIGLDPLQQRLAIMLIEKLNENMQGFYPSISRVLLAVIGPYERHQDRHVQLTAFGILRDAAYRAFFKLKQLQADRPDRFSDFFPGHVKYDPAADALTFMYRSGEPVTTNLTDLNLGNIDLLDPRYHRWTPMGDQWDGRSDARGAGSIADQDQHWKG
jgi:hypothetical protein